MSDMRINVLFFGATADIVGKRREELEVDGEVSAGSILDELRTRFPYLAAQKLHISIEQEYASSDSIVKAGDEIAIFTSVSGG
ncbi:MAG: MoaD/ThiS family protein [Acidobacteria bacterium]|nr:MoaD/ThiS family protein [Acidobacteriota bacterium]